MPDETVRTGPRDLAAFVDVSGSPDSQQLPRRPRSESSQERRGRRNREVESQRGEEEIQEAHGAAQRIVQHRYGRSRPIDRFQTCSTVDLPRHQPAVSRLHRRW